MPSKILQTRILHACLWTWTIKALRNQSQLLTMDGSTAAVYLPKIATLPTDFSQLLTEYSSISLDTQIEHVLTLRDRAYAHYPYPCLGRFRFLDLDLSCHPIYKPVVLPLLSPSASNPSPPTYLDLGCCLAQDIRKLLFDLSPSSSSNSVTHHPNIYGADLRPEFIEIGYELFLDEKRLPRSQFVAPADVFDASESNALTKAGLDGKVGVLHSTSVFHLFDWEGQKALARRCLRLLEGERGLDLTCLPEGGEDGEKGWKKMIGDKQGKRALMLGSQAGNEVAGHYVRRDGRKRYRHNPESWREMWEEVVKEEEWTDLVDRVEVDGHLVGMKDRLDRLGRQVGGFTVEERSKVIGRAEDGYRWHVWWVWIVFK